MVNNYITGQAIKRLRDERGITQAELAECLGVSDKAISKWETGKGFPDIALIEPLGRALGVSIMELLSGEPIVNNNRSSNLLRSKFYVCSLCGNTMYSIGESVISCCGITLLPLEAEMTDEEHSVSIEIVEEERFITVKHPMTKDHYISFIAYVTSDTIRMVKWYPEGNAETRIQCRGRGYLYIYCNKHGLMKRNV